MTYIKTNWVTGDIITAEKLNKIEDGIASAGSFDLKGLLERTITEAVTPEDVTSISDYAFSFCASLTSIELPNVTSIGEDAFGECYSLTSVEMPNVTSIEYGAFAACEFLSQVVINNINPPVLGSYAFDDCHADLKIYVPASAVDTYKAASGWSTYASKIEAIQE